MLDVKAIWFENRNIYTEKNPPKDMQQAGLFIPLSHPVTLVKI